MAWGWKPVFFQTKAQLVEWVIEWLNGLCWSCFNSVTPCLVWSSVGFPHHHQPKLHTNNNWKGTVGCTVWYVNHTHYGLLLGRACGAAYSCVVPSGNPILKKGGRGGYNCSHILILIYEVSSFMLPTGCCFDLSSCATCYFWANTLNQGVAGEKPGEHLFWPPRPILSILWQAGGGQAAIIGGRRQKGCHCLSCHRKLLHLYHLQCFFILCLNCGELCCTLMMPFLNPSTLKSDPPSLSFPPFSKRGEKPFCHNYCA